VAPLFPLWSDTVFKVALAAFAVAIPGVFIIPIVYVRTPYNLDRKAPIDQPLQFDHRHHVQDDGIECLYCHSGAERTAVAGVPPTELCMGCHSQIWNTSPMLEPVRRSYFSGLPIAWSRVHLVPDFVFFNHAIHVSRARVACAECHGDVAAMALPHRERLFTMGWCLDCHARRTDSLTREPALAARTLPPDAPDQPHTLAGPTRITTCTTCHR
jgi:hypothetical protein